MLRGGASTCSWLWRLLFRCVQLLLCRHKGCLREPVVLSVDTSLETPRMAAEHRTVIGAADFTEAEHSVITINTELAMYVCFRTCKRHGLEVRRRGEIRFHHQTLHFTKLQTAQSWDSLYLMGKIRETCLARLFTALSNNYAVLLTARKMCFNTYFGLSHTAHCCTFVLTSSFALPCCSQTNVWCKQVQSQISYCSKGFGIQHL